jgi:hypothetical protein
MMIPVIRIKPRRLDNFFSGLLSLFENLDINISDIIYKIIALVYMIIRFAYKVRIFRINEKTNV